MCFVISYSSLSFNALHVLLCLQLHLIAVHIILDVDVLPVVNHELIRIEVMNGNRPPLVAITGPAELVSFATRWIPLCWHESPDQRLSFHGK